MEENKEKQFSVSEDEFNKLVCEAIFDKPIFTLSDLINMGVVGKKQLKNLLSEEVLKQL